MGGVGWGGVGWGGVGWGGAGWGVQAGDLPKDAFPVVNSYQLKTVVFL